MNGLITAASSIYDGNWGGTSSGSTITISTPYLSVDSNAQSSLSLNKSPTGEISPRLYIKYVKSKLSKTQKERLQIRLRKLQKLVADAKDMGQISLYENLAQALAIVVRESEAHACGINTYVDRSYIDKFMHKVQEKPVKFEPLHKFPRTMPLHIRKKVKQVTGAKLFDNYDVLYLDYTKEDNRTNKDKIRDKDPILFGSYSYQPHRFYFICDWVDAFCDLTLDKFVDAIKVDSPEFGMTEVPKMDEDFFEKIKKEVYERHERLSTTKRDNYKDLIVKEEESYKKEVATTKSRLVVSPWYRRMFIWKKIKTQEQAEQQQSL